VSELEVGDPSANLRGAAISGLRWASMARLVAEIVAFGSSIILARLISPAEFGRAAVALSLAGIAPVLASQGFGAPLIQLKRLERRVAEGAFLLSALTGIGLGLVTVFALAPYVFAPIFGDRIATLVQQAAPIFVLAGVGTVPNALLQRALGFARLAQIEVAALLAGIVVSVLLAALAGLNAEAIVAGANATALVATIAAFVSAPRVRPRWHRGSLAGVTRFGSAAALSSLAYAMYKSVDYWILAARLPVRDVGLYWRGYQLGIEYQTKITRIMLRLAFPLYARSADLDQMRRMRRQIVRFDTVAVFPLLAVLVVVAPAIVPFLYGDGWDEAVVPTQILAVAGMAVAAGTGTGPLMLALGKPGALFFFDLLVLVGYASLIFWVADEGLVAVCIAAMLFQFVVLAGQYSILERRYLGVPLRVTWGAIVPASVATGVALLLGLPAARGLQGRAPDMLVAAVLAAMVLLAYAVTLRVAFRTTWSETLGTAGAVLRRPRRHTPPIVQPASQPGPRS
jgi:O-antigen/teichoic acid export membrane protein